MPDESFSANLSLIRGMSPQDIKKNIPPYLSHFQKDNKDLYYIGTRHGGDFENRSHEIISQAVGKYKPQLIIIEGVETASGLSPHLGLDPKNPGDRQRFWHHSGENVHTAEAARALHIPFIGGEPTTESLFHVLETHGYSAKEAMALSLLRSIPSWRRKGVLKDKEHFAEQATGFLLNDPVFKHIPKESRLTFQEFNAWYDAHKAEIGGKDVLAVVAGDSDMLDPKHANYFQKMSGIMDRARDEHLVQLIADSLTKNDKVMVVYGNFHQHSAAPVFEVMFGGKGKTEFLLLGEMNPPVPEAKTASEPHINVSVHMPSKSPVLPDLLTYGSLTLLVAAITMIAMAGLLSLPAIMLLAGSAATFAGAKIAEKQAAEPVITGVSYIKPPVKIASPIPIHHVARNDGKSWAETATLAEKGSQNQRLT